MVELFAIAIPAFMLAKSCQLSFKEAGWKKTTPSLIIMLFFLGFFLNPLLMASTVLTDMLIKIPYDVELLLEKEFESLFEITEANLIPLMLLIVFLPALTEEFLFRGVFQGALHRMRVSVGWQLALPALAFAAMHADPRTIPVMVIFGVFLSWLRYRLGSIIPGSCLHAGNNAAAFFSVWWAGENLRLSKELLMDFLPECSMIVGLLFLLLVRYIHKVSAHGSDIYALSTSATVNESAMHVKDIGS